MKFTYCPDCGSKLGAVEAGDDGLVPYCNKCEKIWFDMFPSCSIILIYNEYDEIALSHQSYISDKYATFTAGYITAGETAEECAYREAEEELGIKLQSLEGIGTYWFGAKGILMHCFVAFAKKQDFTLSPEVDSAEWMPSEKVADCIFPESPGNAAWKCYHYYMDNIRK